MSTNAIIAIAEGDGFTGRYVHWNGYPTCMVPVLQSIHAAFEHDVAKTTDFLLHQHTAGWSKLSTNPLLEVGYISPRNEPPFDPECDDGGPAYAEYDSRCQCYCHGERSDTSDAWVSSTNSAEDFCWAYVLSPAGIAVMHPKGKRWNAVAVVDWTEARSEGELVAIECGHDWERCEHMAYAHVESLTYECKLSMQEWVQEWRGGLR